MTAIHLLSLTCILTSIIQVVTSSSSTGSSGAPWQPATSDSRCLQEADTYSDLPPTVFSPTGRLHSVETIVEAAKSSSNPRANLVLAMNCRDGIVMISNTATSPYLNTTTTISDDNNSSSTASKPLFLENQQNSIFHQLSPSLMAATAGNIVDGHVLKHVFHQVCQSLMQQSGGEDGVQASLLARHLADQLQIPTQTIGKNEMLASFGLLVGNNELWRLDPTGQFWKSQAAVIGCNANKAEAKLYQRLQDMKEGGDDICQTIQKMSSEEALRLLMDCLEASFPAPPTSSSKSVAAEKIYWQAMVQYHTTIKSTSRRMFQRGAFVPHSPATSETAADAA